MMKSIRALCALLPLAILAGCSEPEPSDIEKLVGQPVKDVACAEASGKAGYTCTYKLVNAPEWSLTCDVVKGDSGWYLPDTACSKPDIKKALIGRWESPKWKYGSRRLSVQFKPDGELEHLTPYGMMRASWMVLEDGDIQITHPNGWSPRCGAKVRVDSMTLKEPGCLQWDDVGSPFALVKQ